MSHDIRTPMNAIIGFTTLAASRADNPQRVWDYLGKIITASRHLLSLINDVLDMSRIEKAAEYSLPQRHWNFLPSFRMFKPSCSPKSTPSSSTFRWTPQRSTVGLFWQAVCGSSKCY